jgi:hypothetical protein
MGRFNEQEGSGLELDCVACASGQYQSVPGSVACVDCPKGKANADTASTSDAVCIDCLPGTHTNDQTGLDECEECLAGTHSNDPGQATCVSCERGKWSETAALATDCDACQEINHCPGGNTCMTGRTSKLCHKCAEFFFSTGSSCVPCPENDFAQYILMFFVFAVACALLYYLLAATSKLSKKRSKKQKQKQADAGNKKKKKNTKPTASKGSANKGQNIDGTHATTALGAVALVTTHTQVLAFILPTVVLPALPKEFADFLHALSNIFSIDITAFVSSPECIWKLSFSQEYLMKMIMPLLFFAMFFCWAMLAWW